MADTDILVAGLAATGGLDRIDLAWTFTEATNPLPYLQHDHFEVWSATSSNRALASKLADATDLKHSHTGLGYSATRYYWVRGVDKQGNLGDFYPVSATGGVSGTSRAKIDTVDLVDNAATKGVTDTGSNYVYSTSGANTTQEEIFSTSFTPKGGALVLLFNVRAVSAANVAEAFGTITIRLKKNGSTVKTITGIGYDEDGSTKPQDGYCFQMYTDNPAGSSAVTWSLTVQGISGDLYWLTLKDIAITFINLGK